MFYRFIDLSNFDLLFYQCPAPCGETNILGFYQQLDWEKGEGDTLIVKWECSKCGEEKIIKKRAYMLSLCEKESCCEKDCRGCYEELVSSLGESYE